MYSIDAMTRRAQALQKTDDNKDMIQINSSLANKLNVSAGDIVVVEQEENSINAPVMINDAVSDNGVLIQAAHVNYFKLGAWHGNVSLSKA
jgi:predicted molibdopterin-dependent oxidoreductase YjgC